MANKEHFLMELEPYHFMKTVALAEKELFMSSGEDTTAHKTFSSLISISSDIFKKTQVGHYYFSEEIIEIMTDSQSNFNEYFKLPYQSIFINNRIFFKRYNTLINGILIIDNNKLPFEILNKYNLEHNNIGLFYFGLKDGKMVQGYMPNMTSFLGLKMPEDSKQYKKVSKKEYDFISDLYNFVYSTLNLLNVEHEDIVSFVQDNSERNKKREKRNKSTYPNKVKYVKLGGKSYTYAKSYIEAKRDNQYKSYVQGFFRTYKSDRYVNVQGETKWIFPFVRGANLPERPELQLIKVSATKDFIEGIKHG